jgi:hypothetical protein
VSANDFFNLTRARPFVPFRIVTTDGVTYEIRHPDMVFVGMSSVLVGYPSERPPHAYTRYDVVSMRQIVRLEPAETPQSPEATPAGGGGP